MAFWGIEVKPGKPFKQAVDECCRLRLTQATLGEPEPSSKRITVKCKSGDGPGIFICSFIPGVVESCALDLLFDEEIAFSVVGGSSSVHLAGYFEHMEEQEESDINDDSQDESEDNFLFGVDGSGTHEYSEEEDEDMVGQVRNSGVTIEEIIDDETAVIGNGKKTTTQKLIKSLDDAAEEKGSAKKLKKQHQAAEEASIDAEKNSEMKCLESSDIDQSDEDGFAVKTKRKAKKMKENGLSKKRQAVDSEMKEQNSEEQAHVELLSHNMMPEESEKSEKTKKRKKKKKAKDTENKTELPETPKPKKVETSEKTPSKELQSSGKKGISAARKFPNGLEVQDIATGKPDGKQAKPGTRVGMIYIGRLKSNGKIFDSNVGKRPFEFRLGVGEVIKGWDVGVNGMRVGDKRKLTIPPAMGYGSKGVGGIPPNSWLVFDVELVHVK